MGQGDDPHMTLLERLFHGCDETVLDGAGQVGEPRARCVAQKHG